MVIPLRLCMRGVKNLTPSYKNIHNRLFVRHWLHLAVFDDDGRAYFKRTEITFYRK
jgi:vacuolar protein sorting-associated protein 26